MSSSPKGDGSPSSFPATADSAEYREFREKLARILSGANDLDAWVMRQLLRSQELSMQIAWKQSTESESAQRLEALRREFAQAQAASARQLSEMQANHAKQINQLQATHALQLTQAQNSARQLSSQNEKLRADFSKAQLRCEKAELERKEREGQESLVQRIAATEITQLRQELDARNQSCEKIKAQAQYQIKQLRSENLQARLQLETLSSEARRRIETSERQLSEMALRCRNLEAQLRQSRAQAQSAPRVPSPPPPPMDRGAQVHQIRSEVLSRATEELSALQSALARERQLASQEAAKIGVRSEPRAVAQVATQVAVSGASATSPLSSVPNKR